MSLEKTFAEIDSVTQSYKTHFAFTDYIRDKLFEHAGRDANRHNNALEPDSDFCTLQRVNDACNYAVNNFDGTLTHQFIRDVAYRVDPNNQWYSDGWRHDQRHSVNITARMEELLYRVNGEGDFADMHKLRRIGDFHYGMLEVHPFYDGNGRTTRILSNVLMEYHGYAPFLVRSEDRSTYIGLLENCTRQLGARGDLRNMFDTFCYAQENFQTFLAANALKQANDMHNQLDGVRRYSINVQYEGTPRRLCSVSKYFRHSLDNHDELRDVNVNLEAGNIEIISKCSPELVKILMGHFKRKNKWMKKFKVRDTTQQ